MGSWAEGLGRLAGEAAFTVGRGLRAVDRLVGGGGPAHVQAYDAYGRADRLLVRGRVLADKGLARGAETDRWWQNLISAYKRLETDEVPGARVTVRLGRVERSVRSDSEGYFQTWLEPGQPLDPAGGWQEATVELVEPQRQPAAPRVTARALVPPAAARFGVISDLDDTVIRSHATDFLRMTRDVVFGNVHTRPPFDGVAAFYRALHAGLGEAPAGNPVFYVSSSPWNLYDLLVHFLEIHDIPAGPMELRDWGLAPGRLPLGHRRHKLAAIRRILNLYPELPFILIGDSGQQDPEIYHKVVHDWPDRILAVYVRNVSPDPTRSSDIRALAREVVEAGSALVLADDTAVAAEHAADHGWITAEALEAVRAEVRSDEAEKRREDPEEAEQAARAATIVVEESGAADEARERGA